MADCSSDIGNGFVNTGYIDDAILSLPSKVPPASDEELGVPVSGLPHNSPCFEAPPGCHVIDGPASRLPSQQRTSDREHAPVDGEDESLSGPCGYCCWVPSCLQRLASGRCFVLFLSLLSLTEAGLTVGYISSMVTSFELQFRFSSTLTGFVVSCYDIGTLVVILTSYFGGRAAANRPKWIAWSAWAMTLGSSIVTLPHFFIPYKAKGNDTAPAVCHADGEADWGDSEYEGACDVTDEGMEVSALFFLIPGMLLIGAGSTATLTLGTTYIDDFVRKKETPILLAILFSTTVIGPALGFLIGSFFLKYFVDFDTVSKPDIPQSSPHWVGAWWLGFFFFAGAILITAVPIFAFPAKLKKPDEKCQETGMKDQENGEDNKVRMAFSNVSLTKIPLAVWGLLKNPVYMMINVASAAEFSIITGFVRFAPKFVETQFQLEATTASLVTGTLIPVGALGVILGGVLLNRVNTSLMSTMNVLSACTVFSGLLYGLIYIPGPCNTPKMAGVTTSYYNNSPWHRPTDPHNVNLTSPCNALCGCDVTTYNPVCSEIGLSYFSPCYAGCRDEHAAPTKDDNYTYEYFNCTCVEEYNFTVRSKHVGESGWDESLSTGGGSLRADGNSYPAIIGDIAEATTGLCMSNCEKLPLFLALLLLVVFFSSMEQMPAVMALLRCVRTEERPFALGLQFVILRLFGFIPSPIYYGAVIDSTCILWQRQCDEDDGACQLYDNSDFYYRYLGLSTLLKAVSVCTAVVAWIVVRRMHRRGGVAKRTRLHSEGDSGIADDSSESRRNDRLSDEISAVGRFRYTDEVRATLSGAYISDQ